MMFSKRRGIFSTRLGWHVVESDGDLFRNTQWTSIVTPNRDHTEEDNTSIPCLGLKPGRNIVGVKSA